MKIANLFGRDLTSMDIAESFLTLSGKQPPLFAAHKPQYHLDFGL